MTARRRPRRGSTHGGTPTFQGHAAVLDNTARLLRAHLRRKRVDFAPLEELAATLGVTDTTLRNTAGRYPDLGVCGPAGDPQGRELVWWLPPAPLATGFRPVLLDGRLVLQLPATRPGGLPLHIGGAHLGATSSADLTAPELAKVGMGELAYTIARLSLMAQRWLANPTSPPAPGTGAGPGRRLFQLIATTWHTAAEPIWSVGGLRVYQGEQASPLGSRFWNGGHQSTTLELVIWADANEAVHLVNVYPAGTHRNLFGMDSAAEAR